MTLSELHHSPIGTTDIDVRANFYALRPETAFRAVRWEKIRGAVKTVIFYAATGEDARFAAEAYDRKRKEKHAKWRIKRRSEHAARG